ncbi:MAG: hypothetical protein KAI66_17670 [Lentisphaeria bacterium]|nr:hypothetical protein [Lentisphaeria bacterium]
MFHRTNRLLSVILVVFLRIGTLSAQTVDAEVGKAFNAALVPAADLFLTVDMEKMRLAPISKELEPLKEKGEENQQAGVLEMQKKVKQLWTDCGLVEEDALRFTASMVIAGMKTAGGPRNLKLDTINGMVAFESRKVLDSKKILTAFGNAATREGKEARVAELDYEGVKILAIEQVAETAGQESLQMFLALVGGGRVLYIGNEVQVKAAVDRLLAGKFAPMSIAMKKTLAFVPEAAQFRLAFVPTQGMRDWIVERAVGAEQKQQPMAIGIRGMAGIRGVAMQVFAKKMLDCQIRLGFENSTQAQQVQGIVDVMALGMVRMGLMQAAGGKPLPLMNALKCVADGTQVAIKAPLTYADVEVLQDMQKGGAIPGMGGAAPAAAVPAP